VTRFIAEPVADVAAALVERLPIDHPCFAVNPVAEGLFAVTLSVMVGIECAMAGVVAEGCRLAAVFGFRRIAARW
jgi:hypothetical protein